MYFVSIISKLLNLYNYFKDIFEFLQLNLIHPCKKLFKPLSDFSDIVIVLTVLSFLILFVLVLFEEYENRLYNQKYIAKLFEIFGEIRRYISIFFCFLKNQLNIILENFKNPILRKTTIFVFLMSLVLICVDLLKVNLYFYISTLLLWLFLIL